LQEKQQVLLNKHESMCMLGIKIAIAEMKNCSAPGDDEVTVDMMKAAGPIGMQCVYILYKCIVIWKV
jgi:hypothetical protein